MNIEFKHGSLFHHGNLVSVNFHENENTKVDSFRTSTGTTSLSVEFDKKQIILFIRDIDTAKRIKEETEKIIKHLENG